MKKFIKNIVCMFIPFGKLRRKVRAKLLNSPYEIRIGGRKKIINQIRNLPDPIAAYRELCKNLDNESAITASRSLAIIDASPTKLEEIITPHELQEFRANMTILTHGIFKIKNGCYAFGRDMLPINYFEYSVFCTHHGMDAIDLSKIPADSVVIDVGGFIGDSALIFRRYLKNKIYSFEPFAGNYSLMQKTIEMNDIGDQVIPVRLALTENPNAKVFSVEKSTGSTLTITDASSGDELPSDTLDNFARQNGLKVGLVKVDIEGAEQLFLRGGKATIERDKPTMLLSIYHIKSDLDYFNIKKMIESWNLGYKFRIFKPMDNNILGETLLICEQ